MWKFRSSCCYCKLLSRVTSWVQKTTEWLASCFNTFILNTNQYKHVMKWFLESRNSFYITQTHKSLIASLSLEASCISNKLSKLLIINIISMIWPSMLLDVMPHIQDRFQLVTKTSKMHSTMSTAESLLDLAWLTPGLASGHHKMIVKHLDS